MATYLTVTATHDGSVSNRIVRGALRAVDAEELSQSSPIASASRLSTAHEILEADDGELTYQVNVRSGERDEEFTRTTTDAIVAALSTIDGVSDVEVDGGYEPPDEDSED
jgi:hypothetical protein